LIHLIVCKIRKLSAQKAGNVNPGRERYLLFEEEGNEQKTVIMM